MIVDKATQNCFEIFSMEIQKGKNIFSLKYSNIKKIQEMGSKKFDGFQSGYIRLFQHFVFNFQPSTFFKKWSVFDKLKADFDLELIMKQNFW